MKIVNIATCKRREPFLQRCVDSIKGVDQINVLANDYAPKVKGANVIQMVEDFGAKSKFFLQPNLKDCYYFTCDDDLIYHPEYFEYLTQRIEDKERKCVVGVHGSTYSNWPVKDYFWEQNVIYFSRKLRNDKFVSMLGTGTIGFHSSLFDNVDLFNGIKVQNAVDPEFMRICQELKIPRLCVKRPSNFIQEIGGSQEGSIWKGASKNSNVQTEIVNAIGHKLRKIYKC